MDHSADAPLLPPQDDEAHFIDESVDTSPGPIEESESDNGLTVFMWLLTVSAAISGLLFGYDTGIISATLVSTGTSLSGRELSSVDKSIITSSTALFALVATPLSAVVADVFGRKRVLLLADVLFIAGAMVQALSTVVAGMVVGRCMVGAGVGGASFVTPLYIAELAPAAHRGMLVTLNVVSISIGQVVAYVIGWAFAEHADATVGWRWMVGLGALPALLQSLLLLLMPETPRWLVRAGKSGAARNVLRDTVGSCASAGRIVDSILNDIEIEVGQERRASENGPTGWLARWHELLTVPRNRRALTIACLLQALQQLCGFNSLMYFSATIFALLGFTVPTLVSMTVALTNLVFTVGALLLIERTGRRRMLLYSIPLMTVGLLFSGLGFRSVTLPRTPPYLSSNDSWRVTRDQNTAAMVVVASMMIYVAAYALGLGNVPWMQSELFPLSVRSVGSGAATATNWLANFVVGLTFLPLLEELTPAWTFVLYALICSLGWVAIWTIYPETTGLSLEEAARLLDDGWGVK